MMNRRSLRTLQKRVNKELHVGQELTIPLMVIQDDDDGKWYRFDTYGRLAEPIEVNLEEYEPTQLHLMHSTLWTVNGERKNK